MFFNRLFFILILFSVNAFSVEKQQCLNLFEEAKSSSHSNDNKKTELIQMELPLFSEEKAPSHRKKTRYTKEEKARISEEFKSLLLKNNKKAMRNLVLDHPFLKDIRMPLPLNPSKASNYLTFFDAEIGWTALQMASYYKNLDLLNFLLDLGFNYKSKKGKGGVSLDFNPLHIAIIKDFPEGAKSILAKVGLEPFKRSNRSHRFIDEKTGDKRTPWALAVFQDRKNNRHEFIPLIGKYEPSGYVESVFDGDLKDGFQVASEYGGPDVVKLAHKYLKAPDLQKYRELKEKHNYKRTKPKRM